MASGIIDGGTYNSRYKAYIEWSSTSNGSERNSSQLKLKWLMEKIAAENYNAYNSTNSTKVKFNIDGKDTDEAVAHWDLRSAAIGTRIVLREYEITIGHNDDGSRQVSIGGTHIPGNSWSAKTITPQTITLDTIPRKTVCPKLSGEIEDSYTIPLNPASKNFKHSVYVTFGNITGYINAGGDLQSTEYKFSNENIPFTIPSSFYSQFGTKYGIGQLKLRTYNGDSNIGETTAELKASCLESRCRPKITGIVVDSNEITKELTGDENKLVKYFSNASITLDIKPATTNGDKNSTIESKNVDGVVFETDNVTVNKTVKKDFTIMVTNSRGFTTQQVIGASKALVEYFPPILSIDAYRYPDQTSDKVKITYKGSFFNQNFGVQDNTLEMKWYYRKATESNWVLGGTVTPVLNVNEITEAIIDCGKGFNYLNSYRFKVEIIDKLTSEGTKEDDVVIGIPTFSFGENGFQFHVDVYDKNGNLKF